MGKQMMAARGGPALQLSALIFVAALSSLSGACVSNPEPMPVSRDFHDETRWEFVPSVTYDALNLMNGLAEDPFYAVYYGNSVRRFRGMLNDGALAAMGRLDGTKRFFGFVLSAFTTMAASTGPHATLLETADYFDRPEEVVRGLEATPNHRPIHGTLFTLFVGADTSRVLRGLDSAGFVEDWEARKLPLIESRIAELEAASQNWNVLPEVEKRLGRPTAEATIRVHVLAYAQPHAVKLAGNNVVVDMAYPDELVVMNAIHELFHPPVDFQSPSIRELVLRLHRSSVIKNAFDNRGRQYGYNQFEGYVEENIVRALEHQIATHLGITDRSAAARWRSDDDGMHVLAAVLHEMMEEQEYMLSDESVASFLTRNFLDSEISEEEIERLYLAGTGRPFRL